FVGICDRYEAILIEFSTKVSSVKTLYIMPIRSASSAGTFSPSIIKALAFCQPINLGKTNVPLLSGIKPIFEKAWINVADVDATIISQHKAILAPAPAATPLIAATTGFSNLRILSTIGL